MGGWQWHQLDHMQSIAPPSRPNMHKLFSHICQILLEQPWQLVLVFCSYEQVLDINAQTPGRQERRSDGALTDILSWDIAEVVSPCLPRGLWSHDRSFLSPLSVCVRAVLSVRVRVVRRGRVIESCCTTLRPAPGLLPDCFTVQPWHSF